MNPQADAPQALRSWQRGDGDQAIGQALFPADLAVLAGHFPGRPLIPGVHQVALFVLLLQRVVRPGLRLSGISRGKWTAPVLPGMVLDLRARWRLAADSCADTGAGATLIADCECLADGRPTAACRLTFTG